ncbi:DUF2269 family protein [Bacillus taeanensis]|uniref:DUF2269 domain-containing protein n=1 Tax=Bacillus taeanensis TaxID=273032 RepID=A0A366XTG4_9BACI|nr:DUF2269 family protein [Bacillus taeanensis]RBW67444.1 hypothetical protein DS031_22165 [Bacillus taeanensis]
MKTLVLIHVLSAIIGIGPTFFGHILLKKKQNLQELKNSLIYLKKLEIFPKIGGTIAVLSGFLLYFLGDYGSFMQLWLIGTLVLYIFIQITAIGFLMPALEKLQQAVSDEDAQNNDRLQADQQELLNKINHLSWLISIFGITIFVFMIIKPVFG